MQKIFTKTLSWWLLACACCVQLSASAAQYPGDCPCDLYTYQYDGGIKVNAELLYFTSSMHDTAYALRLAGSNQVKVETADFDFAPGFQVELGYQFPGTAYEASLRFLSLALESSSSVDGGVINATLSNYFDITLPPELTVINPIDSAKNKIGLDLRVIELLFGQTVQTASDRVRLKWLVGARSSTIHHHSKVKYFQTAAHDFVEEVLADSEFSGFGPVIGAQALVNLGHGFTVTGEIMTSFLMSKIGARIEDTFTHATLLGDDKKPLTRRGHNSVDYEDRITTAIDSRLGLLYSWPLANDSVLGFEAGVQVSQYLDVDFRFNSSGSDIGFYGLYLRASYLI